MVITVFKTNRIFSQCVSCTSSDSINLGLVWCHNFTGNTLDLTGNGYNGSYNGTTYISDRFGNLNSAILFNGSSSCYIEINQFLSDMTSFSMSFWVKKNGLSSIAGGLFWEGDNTCGKDVFIDMGNAKLNSDKQLGNLLNVNVNLTVANSGWTHFVWTANGTQSKLYKDGILVNTLSNSASWVGNHYKPTYGCFNDGNGGSCGFPKSYFFVGGLDDVRLYNRVLSASEILVLYNLNPNPIVPITAGIDVTLCQGDSIQLLATGANSYFWSPNNGLSNVNINNPYAKPTITTDYIVRGINGSCIGYDTVRVNVTQASANAGIDKGICLGDSVQLNASAVGIYYWNASPTISNAFILNPYVKPTTSTNYVLTSTTGTCIKTDTVLVTVLLPLSLNAGFDESICLGDSIQLNASGGFNYNWNYNLFLSDSTINNPYVKPNITTKFIVKSGLNNCKYFDTVNITINPLPIVNAGRDTIVCKGFPYQLNGQALLADKYSWTPDINLSNANILNPVIQIPQTGIYILKAENTIGNCVAKDSVYILVDSVIAQFTTDIANGFSPLIVNFTNTSINANKYLWELDSVTKSTNVSPTHTYTNNGDYSVILHATNSNGCEDTAMVTIYVAGEIKFQLPNVFTPNGDSINDYFETKISNYKLLKQLKGTIWNRWGQQIYEFSIPNEQWWDGNYEGNPCSDSVYFYIIEAVTTSGKKYNFHGTVTLLR